MSPAGERRGGGRKVPRSGTGTPPGRRATSAGGARRDPSAPAARRGGAGRGGRQGDPTRVPGTVGRRRGEDAGSGEQVEGRQAVAELLRARRRAVHHVTIAESSERSGLVDEILGLAADAGVPVRRVSRERLDGLARTDAAQGVVASADPIPEALLEDLVAARGGSAPFLVVLDGVTDPHNLGAVMRSALCAGATGLVVGRHRSAHLAPTAVKAAAGAAEWLPVAVVAGVPAALAELRAAGVWTVGLDADAPTAVWDLEVATEPVAVVLGAEGSGLSRLARQRCELVVSVPMTGPLGSLNVSAAAALACFEVARRRAAAAPA